MSDALTLKQKEKSEHDTVIELLGGEITTKYKELLTNHYFEAFIQYQLETKSPEALKQYLEKNEYKIKLWTPNEIRFIQQHLRFPTFLSLLMHNIGLDVSKIVK